MPTPQNSVFGPHLNGNRSAALYAPPHGTPGILLSSTVSLVVFFHRATAKMIRYAKATGVQARIVSSHIFQQRHLLLLSKPPHVVIPKERHVHLPAPRKFEVRRVVKPWTAEEMEQLKRYKESGISNKKCAELLQRTVKSVVCKFLRGHREYNHKAYFNAADHAKLIDLRAKNIPW